MPLHCVALCPRERPGKTAANFEHSRTPTPTRASSKPAPTPHPPHPTPAVIRDERPFPTHPTPGSGAGALRARRPTVGPMDPALLSDAMQWRTLPPQLRALRRTVLICTTVPLTVAAGALPALLLGPRWSLLALAPLLAALPIWRSVGRNWRSWRYAEREDDLLINRGVLFRRLTVVPYGRMQLVDVTVGPLERRFGIARVQLHTASAGTDAAIPGLLPEEAARLRDSLAARGQARSAGL